MGPVSGRIETDFLDPRIDDPGVLSGA
jgi:hypothetical protein